MNDKQKVSIVNKGFDESFLLGSTKTSFFIFLKVLRNIFDLTRHMFCFLQYKFFRNVHAFAEYFDEIESLKLIILTRIIFRLTEEENNAKLHDQ